MEGHSIIKGNLFIYEGYSGEFICEGHSIRGIYMWGSFNK